MSANSDEENGREAELYADDELKRVRESFSETPKDESKYFLSIFNKKKRQIYVYALLDYKTLKNSFLLLEPDLFVPIGKNDYRCELIKDFLSFLKHGAEIVDETQRLEGHKGRSKGEEINENRFVRYLKSLANPNDILMISKKRPESIIDEIKTPTEDIVPIEWNRGLYTDIALSRLYERCNEALQKKACLFISK
jgi:hypothetical protein